MSDNAENVGVPGTPDAPKAGGKKANGKGKKKGKELLRSFTKSDIKDLEKLLGSLEAKTKFGKLEALMELGPMIIANIRKGWKPIEIAKVLKEDGHMASVKQTDILRVLRASYDSGSLTEDDVQKFKLKAIFSVTMETGPAAAE